MSIGDCTEGAETARGQGWMCTGRSISELSVWVW